MTSSRPVRPWGSARVAQPAGDAVHGQQARPRDVLAGRAGADAPQQLDLDERERVHERVAAGDRVAQDRLAVEQALAAVDADEQMRRARELVLDLPPDALPDLLVLAQLGVPSADG